jgi:hypothetical protein
MHALTVFRSIFYIKKINLLKKGVVATYTCKYQTATYLMRFFWVDIVKGIENRSTNGERNKFCCSTKTSKQHIPNNYKVKN